MIVSPALEARCELAHGRLGDLAGRDHDPGPARHVELGDEVVERARACRALGDERRDRLGARRRRRRRCGRPASAGARCSRPSGRDRSCRAACVEPIRSAAWRPPSRGARQSVNCPIATTRVGRGRGRVTRPRRDRDPRRRRSVRARSKRGCATAASSPREGRSSSPTSTSATGSPRRSAADDTPAPPEPCPLPLAACSVRSRGVCCRT